ncbi:MAG: hypothetical protein V1977_02630 [Candidatus Diapherotrites archaeon]
MGRGAARTKLTQRKLIAFTAMKRVFTSNGLTLDWPTFEKLFERTAAHALLKNERGEMLVMLNPKRFYKLHSIDQEEALVHEVGHAAYSRLTLPKNRCPEYSETLSYLLELDYTGRYHPEILKGKLLAMEMDVDEQIYFALAEAFAKAEHSFQTNRTGMRLALDIWSRFKTPAERKIAFRALTTEKYRDWEQHNRLLAKIQKAYQKFNLEKKKTAPKKV